MPSGSATDQPDPERYKVVGRFLGPAIFLAALLTSQAQGVMQPVAWLTAGVALWMAVWWATEAIPVAVTALLPLVVFDPLGISTIRDAAAAYANPIVYLFFGGFLMALAMERWNLHRRIALFILDQTGTDGRRLIGGFMLVCALLSMWMTNTSTTMMLLPIALSVLAVVTDNVKDVDERTRSDFRIAMLLGLAYSASIGGLATLIGTPPNAYLIGYLAEHHQLEISFARWMAVGIPVSAIMLPITWIALTRFIYPVKIPANDQVSAHLSELRDKLGPMSPAEKRVAMIFGTVVFLWMAGRQIADLLGVNGVSDAGIVMAAAVVFFLAPSGSSVQRSLLSWEDTQKLPWGVLILFGGGLSLAAAVSSSGLALWLGEGLAPLNAWGTALLVVAAVAMVIFLTELTSNLATTATLLPVMGAIALQAGVHPLILTVPVTIAASCAFMLPVATPPNAIVFATGQIRIPQMIRAGLFLNIIGIIIVSIISLFLAPAVLQ
ncbi:MAG: DASS family sodium-coupled anion symporter [Gammaproteobacteria bacterium]|nr:DASS family sodium-coupled anion symporter [Gammaproteobacteria bacterium]